MAELTEPDLGAALLNLGRLDEHDDHVGALAARYRANGPPTLHNWTLMLLGYSAAFRGDQQRAERIFGEALDVEVPAGTHSPNRSIEAGVAFRRGERERALRILRGHLDELEETGNMQGVSVVAVEFIPMMVALGRLEDAARSLAHLRANGLLDAPGFRHLLQDAIDRVGQARADEHATPRGTAAPPDVDDDRGALAHMRAVLDDLLAPAGAAS